VRRVAMLHGAELQWTAASRVDEWSVTRTGLVVATENLAEPAARLYAQLSGRAYAGVAAVEELTRDLVGVAVLVTRPECLTYETLLALHSGERNATGLILGNDAAGQLLAVKQRIVALWCAGTRSSDRVFLFTRENFESVSRAEGSFLGAAAPNSQIRDAVGRGAGMLFVSTHSVGFDLRLGPNLQLCPYKPGQVTSAPRPLCLELGKCTQLPRLPSVEDAWADERFASADVMQANIMVLYGCGLLRLSGPLVSEDFNIGLTLNEEAVFGACLVTYRSLEETAPDGREFYPLLNELSKGAAVGGALRAHNKRAGAPGPEPFLVLLGDPDYRVARMALPDLPEVWPAPPVTPPKSAEPLVRLVARRSLVASIARNRVPPEADAWRVLDRAFEKLAAGELGPPQAPQRDETTTEFNDALVELVGLSRQGLLDAVVERSVRDGSETHAPCFNCRGLARVQHFREHVEGVGAWRVHLCDSCGSHEIAPVGIASVVDFTEVASGRLRIPAAEPGARASVCVRRAYSHAADFGSDFASLSLKWPTTGSGELAEEFELPSKLPEGPLRCAVCLAWGESIAMGVSLFRVPTDVMPSRAGLAGDN
jgi:hypothetical protein